MRKIIRFIFFLLLVNFCNVFAQSIKFENLKQSSLLENAITKDKALFLSDKSEQLIVYLDNQNSIIDSLRIPNISKKYKNLIAYTFNQKNINLFWENSKKDSVFVQQISFENKTFTSERVAFKYSKRLRKLTEFQHNSEYFIVSIEEQTNELTFHVFDSKGQLKERKLLLDGESFLNFENKPTDFYNNIASKFSHEDIGFKFQHIFSDEYTALSLAISERKAYVKQNQLLLSLDQNPDHLYVLDINLNLLTYKIFEITSPSISKIDETICNTFILDETIYISKIGSDNFCFLIKDFNNQLIREWKVMKEQEIPFKTTPIIQLNGEFTKQREIEKTSQFLRKSTNMKSALTAYNYKNDVLMTFGAVSNEKPKATFGLYFGLIGAVVDATLFSPSLYNLDAYANRKVVQFNSLLNPDFKVLNEKIDVLAIEQINIFVKAQKNEFSNYTLSNFKENYYLGYYDKRNKSYSFKIFTD